MHKKYENRTDKITVRVTKSEHDLIKHNAKHYGMSQSNYLLSSINKNKDNKNKINMKLLTNKNVGILNKTISIFYDRLNQFRLDYARALSNLEHDNDLYNHGQLQNIPRKTLETAKSAVLANKKELQGMEANLNTIEMNLYDN